MSTAKAAIVESISKGRLRGLPSRPRKAAPAERLEKIKDMASAPLHEAEALDHENALAEASVAVDSLSGRSEGSFFDEGKRVEMRLIGRAFEPNGGGQGRAATTPGV